MKDAAPTRVALPPRRQESVLELLTDLLRRPWVDVGVRHYLDDYQASQWLDERALRHRQLALLRRLAWHCYLNVPHHRRAIGEVLRPLAIETLDGPELLPVGAAADRRARPEEFRATDEERVTTRLWTAGVHGKPQPVLVDHEAALRRSAVRMRSEWWAGAPPARLVPAWGSDALSAPRPLDGNEIGALAAALHGQRRAAVLSAPGSTLDAIAPALAAEAGGLRAVIVRGRGGGLAAARLTDGGGARLSTWYASAEFGVIAATCDRGKLHIHADHLLVEAIDDHGRPTPPGDVGRLLVTDLHNRAAPYLRHEIGDRGRLLPLRCRCGRALPLLELADA